MDIKAIIKGQKVIVRTSTQTICKWNVCLYCKEKFISARRTAKYCSNSCRVKHYQKRMKKLSLRYY